MPKSVIPTILSVIPANILVIPAKAGIFKAFFPGFLLSQE